MTDESENYEYATEADLPIKQKFPTTRKAGYVEDEVDVWVEKTVKDFTEFLNRYNNVVYALSVEKDNVAKLSELNAALQTQVEELSNQPVAAPQEAVVEEEVAVVEEAPVAPVVATVPEPGSTFAASRRAREIMDEAAGEAADHVSRALERVARIETEAEVEAQEILAKAEGYVQTVVAEAEEHGRAIREAAASDARIAETHRDEAVAQTNAIMSRLDLFYSSQLEELRNTQQSVGYSPILEINGQPLVAVDAPSETQAIEASPYEADASYNTAVEEVENTSVVNEDAGVEIRNEDNYTYAEEVTDDETDTPSADAVEEVYSDTTPQPESHEQTTVVAPLEGDSDKEENPDQEKNSSVFGNLFHKNDN